MTCLGSGFDAGFAEEFAAGLAGAVVLAVGVVCPIN